MRDLLGGKGAGLAEMTNAGLPTPPGFTITTEACNDYFAAGEQLPDGLWDDVLEAVKEVEREHRQGLRRPGQPAPRERPVRRQVLDARDDGHGPQPRPQRGDRCTASIALTGNERFGWDAYRRFIQMFGRIVMDVEGRALRPRPRRAPRRPHGADARTRTSTPAALQDARRPSSRRSSAADTGRDFPERPVRAARPRDQGRLRQLVRQARRATTARTRSIADDLGTAVNVVTMVFGNMGDDSGTGVAFTRDPNTGEKVLFGEYLTNAQGEDVVAGIRTAPKIAQMADRHARGLRRVPAHRPAARDATTATSRTSSSRSSAAACTCSRPAPPSGPRPPPCRSPPTWSTRASITKEEAIAPDRAGPRRPAPARPVRPGGAAKARHAIAKGLNASPGRGRRARRVRRRHRGRVGRARREGRPRPHRDLARRLPRHGRGPGHHHGPRRRDLATPRSSPARSASRASPARAELVVDYARQAGRLRRDRHRVQGGRLGQPRRLDRRALRRAPCRRSSARFEDQPELQKILGWADEIRRMGVWTNADKPEEAAQARELRRRGHRPVPDRAHVPRRASGSRSCAARSSSPTWPRGPRRKRDAGEDARRRRGRGGGARSTPRWPSSRSSSRATSRASSRRWTACRSSSG